MDDRAPKAAEELPFRTVDSILTGEGIVPARIAKVIGALQVAATPGQSPSLEMASAILAHPGARLALFTGFVVPQRFPQGENDGPLGAVALGRALCRAGFRSTLLVDPPLLDTAQWLAAEIQAEIPVVPITQHFLASPSPFPVAIAIEKPGQNEQGVMHTYDGERIANGSIAIDAFFDRMNATGGVTMSIADRGNEVGFGGIRDQICELIPEARQCSCGCGGGIAAVTPSQHLLPAAVSNWGAYGVAAALAILTENRSLLLLPEEEERMLKVAAVRGCRDGVRREGVFGVDGISGEASVRLVATLAKTVRQAIVSPQQKS